MVFHSTRGLCFLNSAIRWTQAVSISELAYALHEGQHRDLGPLLVHIPSSESHSSLSPEGKWGSQMPSCIQAPPGIPRKYMLFSITRDLASVAPCGVSKRWEMKISDLAFLLTELIPRAERIQNTCNAQVPCSSKVINKKCRCH